jgi:glycerol-1-phosphate dehydrogenase [NAD(P)+]
VPLLSRTVSTPLIVEVGRGALDRLGAVLADRRVCPGDRIAVVVGTGIGGEIAERVRAAHPHLDVTAIEGGTFDAAMLLANRLRDGRHDAVVGIGGGRVLDTVKVAASHCGLPMVAVATSLAHDGIASPVSTLERGGASVSYGAHIPLAAIVDLDYVLRSPVRRIRAGVGDALSNLSALADWELGARERGESVDGVAALMARTGAQALLSHPGSLHDEDFLLALADALLLGGMAMAVAGSSRPCSGGCHEITHAVGALHPEVGALHGELAGVGALYCTWLRGDKALFGQLDAAFRRHGLARTPRELGLTDEQFAAAVAHAPETRPERYTILEHLALPPRRIADSVASFGAALTGGEAATPTRT